MKHSRCGGSHGITPARVREGQGGEADNGRRVAVRRLWLTHPVGGTEGAIWALSMREGVLELLTAAARRDCKQIHFQTLHHCILAQQ